MPSLDEGRHLFYCQQCHAMGPSTLRTLHQHIGLSMNGLARGGSERRTLRRQLDHVGGIDPVQVARLQFKQRQVAPAIAVCPINSGRDQIGPFERNSRSA